MTEQQWNESREPQPMLEFLRNSGRLSPRKATYLACASVRQVWGLLLDENEKILRRAVEMAERLADRDVTIEKATALRNNLRHPILWAEAGYDLNQAAIPDWAPHAAVEFAVKAADYSFQDPVNVIDAIRFAGFAAATATFIEQGTGYAATHIAEHVSTLGPSAATLYSSTFQRVWEHDNEVEAVNGYAVLVAWRNAKEEQCRLLRDIFASPFLPAPSLPNSFPDSVVRLAVASYEERELPSGRLDPQRLAVLADAVEEAALPSEVVVHLRSPGPHYRGCFAVDLLLGRS